MSTIYPKKDPTDRAENDVVEQLDRLLFAFRGGVHRLMRDAEMSIGPMELRMLLRIAHHPGCTASDLAKHSGRDKAQIARLITQLQATGLIQRVPHPGDGRVQCLSVTDAGHEIHTQMQAKRKALAAEMLRSLDTGEQVQLAQLLNKLHSSSVQS